MCVLQLVTLFKAYFDGELCEASIKNNYVLIYELLDEVSCNACNKSLKASGD